MTEHHSHANWEIPGSNPVVSKLIYTIYLTYRSILMDCVYVFCKWQVNSIEISPTCSCGPGIKCM